MARKPARERWPRAARPLTDRRRWRSRSLRGHACRSCRVHPPGPALRAGRGAGRRSGHIGLVDRRQQPGRSTAGGPHRRASSWLPARSPALLPRTGRPRRLPRRYSVIALASVFGTVALSWEVHHAIAQRWRVVPPAKRGVLLMNPRSGDGKVTRLGLADEARRRGIEPVVLGPGDDLRALAKSKAARGADVLGMAGGDGSQAAVAAVAAAHGLAFVCVPASRPITWHSTSAPTAGIPFGRSMPSARPVRPPLTSQRSTVRSLSNNVSLGLYARVIASDQYRQAKRRTVAETLPDLLFSAGNTVRVQRRQPRRASCAPAACTGLEQPLHAVEHHRLPVRVRDWTPERWASTYP